MGSHRYRGGPQGPKRGPWGGIMQVEGSWGDHRGLGRCRDPREILGVSGRCWQGGLGGPHLVESPLLMGVLRILVDEAIQLLGDDDTGGGQHGGIRVGPRQGRARGGVGMDPT